MAGIINTSINLNAIPKDKIVQGKKGKYLPITITINDDLDNFGNQGPVVVWTNGEFPSPPPREDRQQQAQPQQQAAPAMPDDLPF